MKRRVRLIVSGMCAAGAVVMCLLYGNHVESQAESIRAEAVARYGGEVTRLLVATKTLEAGDVVSSANVTEKEWLSDLAPKGALTSFGDVAGKQVSVPVTQGAPLCELNFRESSAMAEVPSGYVALSVPLTDKLGLSSAVEVGTSLAAYRVADGATSLLTSDVQVLLAPTNDGSSVLSKGTLCVAVRPADVTGLLSASTEGSLRLVIPAEDIDDLSGAASGVAPTEVLPETGGAGATGTTAGSAAAGGAATDGAVLEGAAAGQQGQSGQAEEAQR